MRKGYRSADARPLFFENGLLYCKLTAASAIQKGQLLVSFGAVGRWSFAMLKQGLINLGTFQKDLIGLCEFVVCVRWFEVCKTSELP